MFAVIGGLVARAGWTWNPSEAGGVERSLDIIAREQSGYLFILVAVGLMAYGLFEIATANPGFAIDEPVASLGTSLRIPVQFERARGQIERLLPPIRVTQ